MATQRNKNTGRTTQQPSGPVQPAWKGPPPKPRKQMRRNAANGPRVPTPDALTLRTSAAAARREPKPRSRARENAWIYARAALFLLAMIGCAAGLVGLLHLPQLTVTRTSIQIGGSHRISTDEIYKTSGLEGRSILQVRPTDVAARISGIQGIAGTDVHLRLPNRVLIDVREFTPLVAWQGITTTVWLSANNTEVPQVGELPPLKLSDRTGASLEVSRQNWRDLMPGLAEIQKARPDLSELFYDKSEGLYFIAPEGWAVWLGKDGPMATKLALLEAAQREITAQGARPTVIDVRSSALRAFWW